MSGQLVHLAFRLGRCRRSPIDHHSEQVERRVQVLAGVGDRPHHGIGAANRECRQLHHEEHPVGGCETRAGGGTQRGCAVDQHVPVVLDHRLQCVAQARGGLFAALVGLPVDQRRTGRDHVHALTPAAGDGRGLRHLGATGAKRVAHRQVLIAGLDAHRPASAALRVQVDQQHRVAGSLGRGGQSERDRRLAHPTLLVQNCSHGTHRSHPRAWWWALW